MKRWEAQAEKEVPLYVQHVCVECGHEQTCRLRLKYGIHTMCEIPDASQIVKVAGLAGIKGLSLTAIEQASRDELLQRGYQAGLLHAKLRKNRNELFALGYRLGDWVRRNIGGHILYEERIAS